MADTQIRHPKIVVDPWAEHPGFVCCDQPNGTGQRRKNFEEAASPMLVPKTRRPNYVQNPIPQFVVTIVTKARPLVHPRSDGRRNLHKHSLHHASDVAREV